MGECGCASNCRPEVWIPGPANGIYAIAFNPPCEHCETPVGVEIKYWHSAARAEEEVGFIANDDNRLIDMDDGYYLPTLDPRVLYKRLVREKILDDDGVPFEDLVKELSDTVVATVSKWLKAVKPKKARRVSKR